MAAIEPVQESKAEIGRLVRELEQAESYELRLRSLIMAVKEELAAGNAERALSMLNEALNDIDSATDVVVQTKGS